MKLNTRYFFCICMLGLMGLLFSCGTAPPPTQDSESTLEEPDWIQKYPVDSNYFIGIGSSNTGNRGEDMDKARLDALAALSSSIVTTIEGELIVESSDDTEGNSYTQITQRIKENVQQNLKGVEPVDSFYSPQEGYWFYFRFPKSKLAEMKAKLKQRVVDMVGPAVKRGYPTVAEGIALLWDGYALIDDSPFVGTIQAELGPYSGALIDILQKEISRLSASLSMSLRPEELYIEEGESPEITLKLSSDLGLPAGQFRIILSAGGEKLSEVLTDRDGAFTGKLKLQGTDPGRVVALWKIDFSTLGVNTDTVRLFNPETSTFMQIDKKSVGLAVRTGSKEPFQGLFQSVGSLFSKRLPYEIVETVTPEKTGIVFTLHFRDLPENDYGLFITFARAVVHIEKAGKTIYSYETEEYKEGGLTTQQARERAKAELFSALNGNTEFFMEVRQAVSSK